MLTCPWAFGLFSVSPPKIVGDSLSDENSNPAQLHSPNPSSVPIPYSPSLGRPCFFRHVRLASRKKKKMRCLPRARRAPCSSLTRSLTQIRAMPPPFRIRRPRPNLVFPPHLIEAQFPGTCCTTSGRTAACPDKIMAPCNQEFLKA